MRRKGSECTRISPAEIGAGTPMISLASRSGRRAPSSDRDRPRQARGAACGSRLLRTARRTAARFYRRARVSIVRAFRSSSTSSSTAKKAAAAAASPECTPARHSSRRQQQSAAAAQPVPMVVVDDSHKSEAVEECIRFMNSSSRKYR